MTDSAKIDLLTDSVSKLTAMARRETEGRLEMCLSLWKFVVEIKNLQAFEARLLADSGVLVEESSRQEFLRRVAKIETECERLEHVLFTAIQPGEDKLPLPPPDAPP